MKNLAGFRLDGPSPTPPPKRSTKKKARGKRVDAWVKMRLQHLQLYPECRVCGEVDPKNHVHHLRYRGKRGESEQPGDLVTLCRGHHDEFHREFGRPGGVDATLKYLAVKRYL